MNFKQTNRVQTATFFYNVMLWEFIWGKTREKKGYPVSILNAIKY